MTRFLLLAAFSVSALIAQNEDVVSIVRRSAEANDRDFAAASRFNYKETDKLHTGTRTTQVTMIDGTPYDRLIAINGTPLSAQQAAAEERKQEAAAKQRKSQSETARQARIEKYLRSQKRDHEMISQLTIAFDFALTREETLNGLDVWLLKATPKAGYRPPTMQAQVLPAMQGEMWIDKKTYEWVKVTAEVVRAVSIEGFLAQVQPGTRFEIEKSPAAPGIWQITHYSSRAQARVLHVFNHSEQEDVTYFDFEAVKP